MPEDEFDDEIVRVELIRKVQDDMAAAFARRAGKKGKAAKGPQQDEMVLCGYNAAGQVVTSMSGGTNMKLMTASGWQDGTEGARLAEEIRLLRQAIAPSGRAYKS